MGVKMKLGSVYFDKYRVLEVLGQGGTSEVYLAENIKLGNKWAIKKVNKDVDTINLLAEPNILKNLNHMAIPKIIDIEEDEDSIYIIEEYVEGITLNVYKMTNPEIDVNLIIQWAIKLCDVLNYLHTRKPNPIIYRDMKPENIMLTDDGIIKLIDFGIAREYKDDCKNDTVPIGTRGYAAPEQYGIGQSDVRTDIFSLGMTLYYLLTSKNLTHPPYKIQETEKLNNETSNKLFEIVLKCCEILPNQRYQSITDLEKDIMLLNENKEKNIEHIIITNTEEAKEKSHQSKSSSKNILKLNKTITIASLGVAPGVGVTHSSIMLSMYLAKNKKVALIEVNNSGHFNEIAKVIHDEYDINQKHFTYQKVHFFSSISISEFIASYRDQYDFVILDMGSFNPMSDIGEFIRADYRFIIGQSMDWKVNEILAFYESTKEYDPNKKWVYLIPFMDKKNIKDIKRILDSRVYPLPFNMNPFEPKQEIKKVFEATLSASL